MSIRLRHWKQPDGTERETWTVDVSIRQPNGEIKRVVLKSPVQSRPGAQRFERQVVAELQGGTFGVEVKPMQTLAEFAPRFLQWSEGENKPSTYVAKQKAFTLHILPELGELRLDGITSEKVAALGRAMAAEGLGRKTVANVQGYLMRALRLAEEWDGQFHAPRVRLDVPEAPEVDWLEPEETDRFLEAASYWPERYPLLLVALDSGMRAGELLGLRWGDVDLEKRRLHVRRTYVAVTKGFGTPKADKSRQVELTVRAVEALKAARHLRGELVFCHADGKPYTHREVGRWAPAACMKAGLAKRVTMHGLRHSCCARLVMAGVTEAAIMEQLGWASRAMLKRYQHLSPSHRRQVAEALEAFDKKKDEKEVGA